MISLLSGDDKENADVGSVRSREVAQTDGKQASQPILPDLIKKDAPSTPAGRLPLPDLIGMGDVKRAVQDISPQDRIEWDVMSSNPSSTSKTRARKRARSSSPLTSPPGRLAEFINSRAQVDPGSELWGRYSLSGSNAPTPQGASVPALAHIMHTSSPQPSKESITPRSGGAFRRANSCGNQFPKRRRVGGGENDDVFTESVNLGPSKLSVLLERVQEGLRQPIMPKQSHRIGDPAAVSSGLPMKRSYGDFEDTLPTEQDGAKEVMAAPMPAPIPIESENPSPRYKQPAQSSSTDYGEFDDDDLDASLLDAFDSKSAEPIVEAANQHTSMRQPPDLPSRAASPPKKHSPEPRPMVAAQSLDSETTLKNEFDDSDEEMFAAVLGDIVAKFDPQNSTMAKDPQIGGISKSDSDDEFGDGGLDEEDFEVAEMTATQSIHQTANSLLPVRAQFS